VAPKGWGGAAGPLGRSFEAMISKKRGAPIVLRRWSIISHAPDLLSAIRLRMKSRACSWIRRSSRSARRRGSCSVSLITFNLARICEVVVNCNCRGRRSEPILSAIVSSSSSSEEDVTSSRSMLGSSTALSKSTCSPAALGVPIPIGVET